MRQKLLHSILVLLFLILSSCDDDGGSIYPAVRLDFLTAQSGSDGHLQTLIADSGDCLGVVEDRTQTQIVANSTARVVSNYELLSSEKGKREVRIYGLINTVSPVPQPASAFKDGVKRDPADLLSIWMGRDYLNLTLSILSQSGKHLFHFIEESDGWEAGRRVVRLSLYHDAGDDVQAYSKRAYLSVPLRKYAGNSNEGALIYFSFYAYDGELMTDSLNYVPSDN